MSEAAVQPAKPRRTWLPMAFWTAGVLLGLGLAWFIGAVAVPVWRTRSVVVSFAAGVLKPAEAIDKLGGEKRALKWLTYHVRLPGWLAPEKVAAVRLLCECGEAALPALSEALDPKRAGQPRERLERLGAIVERHPGLALALLPEALGREPDESVKAAELLLLSLYRRPEHASLFAGFLDDPSPALRAAAADALGILHRPAYRIPLPEFTWPRNPVLKTAIARPVQLEELIVFSCYDGKVPAVRNWGDHVKDNEVSLPGELRGKLQKLMLSGRTAAEREAAARALVRWPPERYRLRIAEWGVWLCEESKVKLAQSVLDEIPPFVHRTGNPAREFADRVNHIMTITKPVIHVSTDCPMALDLEVRISRGRPYFAYPRPDDFGLEVATQYGPWVVSSDSSPPAIPPSLDSLDDPDIPKLGELREGYPWMEPEHRSYGATSASMGDQGNRLLSLGLRWQSLIVSPERQAWMKPPEVPAEEKFRWWGRLRDVPAAWVSGRGEAERFLYYDGPTMARAPVGVKLEGNSLAFLPAEMFPKPKDVTYSSGRNHDRFVPRAQTARRAASILRGLFVEVRDGRPSGRVIDGPLPRGPQPVSGADTVSGEDKLRAALVGMLVEYGLTAEEAGGLADSWAPQFFRAAGRRFLLLLSAGDYDAMCPMAVEPPPTELVRAGILLCEFPHGAAAAEALKKIRGELDK